MTIISTTGAEDGEVLHSQQKKKEKKKKERKKRKDPELTMAQIISFLLQNSDLN